MSNNFSSTAPSLRCSLFISTAIALIIATEAMAKEPAAEKVSRLPSVTVTAKALPNDGAVDGYKTGASRSSMRTNTPLLDTPQSVSVVTQDQIRDQNITSVGEAIRYVPGITLHQGESNRDSVVIRGNTSTADFFIDGARDDAQYFRDLYNVDRIEVLKGPNALAFGRGGSGGLINRVSKTADGSRIRQVIASGGSFDNRRIQADLGDRVNDKISLRLNTMYEKSGTFRQYGDLERYGFNPTATFTLAKSTDLKVGYEYFHDRRFNDRGLPSANGAPYRTSHSVFFGNPTQNDSDVTAHAGYAILTHDFTPTLQLRNYTRYTNNSKFYRNNYADSAVDAAGSLTIKAYENNINRNNFTNQTDITKKFKTGSLSHTALIGMEITRQETKTFRQTGFFNNTATSITVTENNPLTFAPIIFRQSSSDADNTSSAQVYAGYIQDQIDITKYLQVTGGLRYDHFQFDFHNNRSNLNLSRTDGMVSPRAGLVFKPKDSVSLYGSYSVSYLPSSGDQFATLTAQTQAMKPENLKNYEVGAKWDVTPSLNLTAALYQLDRTNTRATDPNNSANFVLTGATRTRGLELAATGRITDKWQIIGGYAFQNAVIESTTSDAVAGKKVGLVPQKTLSLWNKYDFTQEFAAGLGMVSQSDQFATVSNTVKLKGFTRFDGAVYYKVTPSHRIQLNVENLFGRRYIQTANTNNNLQPGSPRAFRVSLIANF